VIFAVTADHSRSDETLPHNKNRTERSMTSLWGAFPSSKKMGPIFKAQTVKFRHRRHSGMLTIPAVKDPHEPTLHNMATTLPAVAGVRIASKSIPALSKKRPRRPPSSMRPDIRGLVDRDRMVAVPGHAEFSTTCSPFKCGCTNIRTIGIEAGTELKCFIIVTCMLSISTTASTF
jgi:hypothetical protein